MKSILVIGLGRFGRHLAQKMLDLGNDVMIVDKDAAIVERYSMAFTDAQIADCTNEYVLRALGIHHFDICFVCIGDNFQSSLVITTLLKDMGAKYVVAKANREIQAQLLKKIGADEVVYPEKAMAESLAIQYNANNVFDYIELTDEYSIYEVPTLMAWEGKTISELNIRVDYRVNIISVKTGGEMRPLPGADYRFQSGDHVFILGKPNDISRITDAYEKEMNTIREEEMAAERAEKRAKKKLF
jgi:trk system potassium uptake protein TrkA